MSEIAVKSEQRGEGTNSWWATYIEPSFVNDDDQAGWKSNGEIVVDLNKEIETEPLCTDEASYNYHQDELFVVFNDNEVEKMIKILEKSLKQKAGVYESTDEI